MADRPRDFAGLLVTLLTDKVQWEARRTAIADVTHRWGKAPTPNHGPAWLPKRERGDIVAGSRYSQTVDLDNWNSSHALAVMSVPPGSRVLDLGTADGSVARALKDRGCTVWGIECDERAADAASQVCDRVIVADLETPETFDTLDGETFDVVLALDVLEHLRDPTPVLRRAARHLTPKGIAIVSIPNVTHGALRVSLLEGRFNYTEQGLLDRTHLRSSTDERRTADGRGRPDDAQNLRVRRELDETEIAVSRTACRPSFWTALPPTRMRRPISSCSWRDG